MISYSTFDQQNLQLSNDLGSRATNVEELLSQVDEYWSASNSEKKPDKHFKDKAIVGRKIHVKDDELAAERIVDIWDQVGPRDSIAVWRIMLLKTFFAAKFLRETVLFHLLSKAERSRVSYTKQKFPAMEFSAVKKRVRLLEGALESTGPVRLTRLGSRTVLIRPSLRACRE